MTTRKPKAVPSDSDFEWASMVKALRTRLNVSQEQLASLLKTNQCTVSRWERGITSPNYRMRKRLAELHNQATPWLHHNLEVIGRVAQELFNCIRNPAMLLHQDGTVIAVSSGSRYRPGMKYIPGIKLLDQTIPQDLEAAQRFLRFLEENDFWNTVNTSFEFHHDVDGEKRCHVATSVVIESHVFCLIERK